MSPQRNWKQYYRTARITEPTQFARWFYAFMPRNRRVVDLGCGNGRDTYLLAKQSSIAIGIDNATRPKDDKNCVFHQCTIKKYIEESPSPDVLYSRFLLHCLDWKSIRQMIGWNAKMFVAECRASGDKPILYPDHERNFINPSKLNVMLILNGYTIMDSVTGTGYAKLGKENPLILRTIAVKA